MTSLFLLILLIILVLLSGFLSGSETAITATSKARIIYQQKKGIKRAGYVIKLLDKKDNVISSLLLSNNYSSLAIQRRDRVGIGYSKTIMNNIDVELAFDMLINENKNGFRKSQISISLTKNINSEKLKQMINMF